MTVIGNYQQEPVHKRRKRWLTIKDGTAEETDELEKHVLLLG
jgi:hypothetical protein